MKNRKFIFEIIAIGLYLILLATVPAHGQAVDVGGFAGSDVQTKISNAQTLGCAADSAVTCVLTIRPELSVFANGTAVTACSRCMVLDYRTPGTIKITAPSQSTANPVNVGAPVTNLCTLVPYNFYDANQTGMSEGAGNVILFCKAGTKLVKMGTSGITIPSSFVYGLSSTTDPEGTPDAGISRGGSAGEVDCGNGSNGDKTCNFKSATLAVTAAAPGAASSAGFGYNTTANAATYTENNSAAIPVAPMLFASCNGTAAAASTSGMNGFGAPNGANTCTLAYNDSAGSIPVTFPRTFSVMRGLASAGGVNASSGVMTLMKNGSATAITCTFGTGTTCTDTTHTATFAAGDRVSVQFTTQAAETLASIRVSVQ